MAWDSFQWVWLTKHQPLPIGTTWDELQKATKERKAPAKFCRGLRPTKHWETIFARERKPIRTTGQEKFYYVECDRMIGASRGEMTNFVKLRWSHENTIHAYPVTVKEVEDELREYNDEEHERFKSEKRVRICLLSIGVMLLLTLRSKLPTHQ